MSALPRTQVSQYDARRGSEESGNRGIAESGGNGGTGESGGIGESGNTAESAYRGIRRNREIGVQNLAGLLNLLTKLEIEGDYYLL